jgi:hypothetical protein
VSIPPAISTELALRAFNADCEFSSALSEFQGSSHGISSVPSLLASANKLGFSWIIRPTMQPVETTWEVILRHTGGAEERAHGDNWVELLTHLLGIPIPSVSSGCEPKSEQLQGLSDSKDEPEAIEVSCSSNGPSTPLNEQQRNSAVEMVKALDPNARKTFTINFRNAFKVPSSERSLIPLITELQHLQFIDRFTVEAAGGVAE